MSPPPPGQLFLLSSTPPPGSQTPGRPYLNRTPGTPHRLRTVSPQAPRLGPPISAAWGAGPGDDRGHHPHLGALLAWGVCAAQKQAVWLLFLKYNFLFFLDLLILGPRKLGFQISRGRKGQLL